MSKDDFLQVNQISLQKQKLCPDCKQWLPTDCFGKLSSAKDGLRRICKLCRHDEYLAHPERTKEIIQKRREALLAKSSEEQEEIRAHLNENYRNRAANKRQAGMCSSCIIRPAESGRSICDHCHAKHQQYGNDLRNQVFAAYGGRCAVCCETNPAFLSVDHIGNDGAEHRRMTGNGHRLYRWLRKNGYPQELFQLLCANCNWRKHLSSQPGEKTYIKLWHAALRRETIASYGGRCVCCGESQTDVLTIDHVNNDGAEHRRVTGAGSAFYSWLRKQRFPQEGFQLLCFNCNRAKFYYGVCPHHQ